MEMWIIVLWILALIGLILIIAWYAGLGSEAEKLLDKFVGGL